MPKYMKKERKDLRRKLPDDITKCCGLCEHARKMGISGEILCTRTKNLKKVSENHSCRAFSFDILAYRPNPAKIPKFNIEEVSEII